MSEKLSPLTRFYLKDKGLTGSALHLAELRIAELFSSMKEEFTKDIAEYNDINFITSGAVKLQKKILGEDKDQSQVNNHPH